MKSKSLLDNAADEYSRLGLTTNQTLTKTQINNLQKDIIWFETKTIDGQAYIVPTIYLSQATRDNLKNNNALTTKSTIYAAGDISLTSTNGKITNNGSITGNNVTLSANSNIINKNFSEITALNNLSLTSSSGSISNLSQLKAGGALSLTAAQDITNSSTIATNAKNLLDSGNPTYVSNGRGSANSGNISSTLLETASINSGSLTINAGNNFNNYAANITTTGNVAITTGGDANFEALELRNRSESSWGHRSKGGYSITDTTTNVGSSLNVGGSLSVNASKDINITGSNLSTTGGDINLNSGGNVNITSAQNSSYSESASYKKGFTVSKSSTSMIDSTTNVASNLISSGNLSITSGADTNIIASNLTGSGSGNITSGGQTNIYNGVDTTTSYFNSSKSKTGFLRKIPGMDQMIKIDSKNFSLDIGAINGLSGGNLGKAQQRTGTDSSKVYISGSSTNQSLIASNLNFNNDLTINSNTDLSVKSSKLKTTTGDIALSSTSSDVNIISSSTNNTSTIITKIKGDRNKSKETTDTSSGDVTIASIESGKNLTITSAGDTLLQSANLTSGNSGSAGNINVNAGNNLLLLTSNNYSSSSTNEKNDATYSYSVDTTGKSDNHVINNNITSNNGGALALNANNTIYAEYNNSNPAINSGSNKPNYFNVLDQSKTLYNPIDEIHQKWDSSGRALNGTGQAAVAVGAVALTVATLGTGAGVSGAMMTAVASSAAATASVSATNASMNAKGDDPLAKLERIRNKVNKDTTSRQSLRNMAIAGATAGLTIGIANGIDAAVNSGTNVAVDSANSASAVNSTNNAASIANNTKTLTSQIGDSLKEATSSTLASSVAQSTINGDSFKDTLRNSGKNILIYTAGNFLATQIGDAAHPTDANGKSLTPTINQPTQLTLHAALGCGIGMAGGGGSGGCASGAAAGVVGEMTGSALKSSRDSGIISNDTAIQLSGLTAAYAALATSIATGQSDGHTANNIFAGQRIGGNAAENNALRYGNFVIQNPKVKENLEKLNSNLIDSGYPDESFVIQITGGDRYRDPNDPSIVRSKTTNQIEKDSAKNSEHLEENGARAADFSYYGISREDMLNARNNTDFAKGKFFDDYQAHPHAHVALPNSPEYNIKR